jgi:hypothetical protein
MDTPVVVNINNTLIITTPEGKERLVKALDNPKPVPFRLTMIRFMDNCQFCPNPMGNVYCHYVSVNDKYGFLSCYSCISTAKQAVKEWHENESYGTANHLKNKAIRVRRSNGSIETDWVLDEYSTLTYFVGSDECVSCIKSDKTIVKTIRICDLLELNSNASDSVESKMQELMQELKL